MVGERNIIREIEDNALDFIFILDRYITEYGAARSEIDYGLEIITLMKNRYKLTKTYGSSPLSSGRMGTAVFRRKEI